jgi:hypothetical protein
MRTVTNYFIVNLSLADVLVTAICLPASLLVDITESWLFGPALCKVIPYLQVRSPSTLTSLSHLSETHILFRSVFRPAFQTYYDGLGPHQCHPLQPVRQATRLDTQGPRQFHMLTQTSLLETDMHVHMCTHSHLQVYDTP